MREKSIRIKLYLKIGTFSFNRIDGFGTNLFI